MQPDIVDEDTCEPAHFSQSKLGMRLWLPMVLSVGLVMAAGWGIRGSFGHSRGAMMPGAMLGLTLAACSMRRDWWQRAPIIGFATAIGWGFGGTSSYGLLIGYSMGGSFVNSLYGYTSLFLIGSLYCGIGAGFLALALTAKRSWIESSVLPMTLIYATWLAMDASGAKEWSLALFAKDVAEPLRTAWLYDTVWLAVVASLAIGGLLLSIGTQRYQEVALLIVLLSSGWLIAMAIIVGLAGIRLNPSRGDAWAGCVGIQVALLAYFYWHRNRVGWMLSFYGLLAGGLGFAFGDFIQALGRAKWGFIGSYPVLQEFGYWTVMEQIFGLCMGIGVALAAYRLIGGGLAEADEDVEPRWFNYFAVFVLVGLLVFFNSGTNINSWLKYKQVAELTLGWPTAQVITFAELMALGLLGWILFRIKTKQLDWLPNSPLGRSQLLCVLVSCLVASLYLMLNMSSLPTALMMFASILTALSIVVGLRKENVVSKMVPQRAADDPAWKLGWKHLLLWSLIPLVLLAFAHITKQLEIPVKQFRFPRDAISVQQQSPNA